MIWYGIEQLCTVPEAVRVPVPTTETEGKASGVVEPVEVADETRQRKELVRQTENSSANQYIQASNPTEGNKNKSVKLANNKLNQPLNATLRSQRDYKGEEV